MLAERYPTAQFHWVIFSATPRREREARASIDRLLAPSQHRNVIVKDFRNGFFPFVAADVKEFFETLKDTVVPDLVFTHFRHDRHQDHRTISELTWNTFRDHLVLEYEIAKYEGDLSHPNLFIPLEARICDLKVDTLVSCFESQGDKQWFDQETFRALLRIRGIECNSPTRYAEAFHCAKARIYL